MNYIASHPECATVKISAKYAFKFFTVTEKYKHTELARKIQAYRTCQTYSIVINKERKLMLLIEQYH
jgi:hypothetical protein